METFLLSEVAAWVGGRVIGSEDPEITGVAGIEDAGPGDLTFLARENLSGKLQACRASAIIVGEDTAVELPAVRVADPYSAFAEVLSRLATAWDVLFPPGIHPTAVVAPDAEVEAAAAIGAYCVIGSGAVIGQGTRLGNHVVIGPGVTIGLDGLIYSSVTIREGCRLHDRVMVHSGAVIGSDGFGFLPTPAGLKKIPQIGIVVLEDDVEIGAGTCVDRATTGQTVIGRGTKIDNQVQIGHNVRIGANCAISAQTGISGSCTLGDQVTTGGQVGIGDHIEVGAGVKIAGRSGLIRDVPAGTSLFGYPALEFQEGFRIAGAMRRLPELLRRVRRLETKPAASSEISEEIED